LSLPRFTVKPIPTPALALKGRELQVGAAAREEKKDSQLRNAHD
jgi:hypothetical protein